jgi:hypothetical protein
MRRALRKGRAADGMVSCDSHSAARCVGVEKRGFKRRGGEMVNDLLKHGALPVRDLRIDFFRGLALFMILVDHVTGDPISKFTYQRLGFSDAAEIFVFLSGVSCGIVYSRVLARRGWTALVAAVARRSMLIYGYYVLASIVIILLLLAASASIKNAGVIDRSFILLREDPVSAIWSTIFLISPPDVPGILVLYIVLTAIVIPLFLMGAARNAALTLAASGFIWAISQFNSDLVPHVADHSYFNPLAWQFLFSIGMFLGIKWDFDWSRLRSTTMLRWSLVAAWTVVVSSFLYRNSFLLASRFQLDLEWFRIPASTLAHMKENLSAVRLLHFLSVALLVATYVKSSNLIFGWSGSAIVARTGRFSLEVFSVSAVLSIVLNIIVVAYHPSIIEKLGLDGVAILLMVLTALALSELRIRRKHAVGPNISSH